MKIIEVRTAADVLGIHESTLRRWADAGRLPAIRLPSGIRRFRADDVERLRRTIYGPEAEAALHAKSARAR